MVALEMLALSAESLVDEVRERARAGAETGFCAAAATDEGLTFALVLRPVVRMGDFHALPFVAAMGIVDAFRAQGKADEVGIRWPGDIVCGAPAFENELAKITVNAGAGEGGMFAMASVAVDEASVRSLGFEGPLVEIAQGMAGAVAERVDVWAESLAGKQVAGPLAPVLAEYFDMVPALGHRVAALSPNGHALAIGTFAGIDVWGRATIKTAVNEQEFASEVARIRTL